MPALSTKQIIGIIVIALLIIGLGVGVYLVRQQQTIKSRAAQSFIDAFEIREKNSDGTVGKLITCTPPAGETPATCNTGTLDIFVKVKDLNPLLPSQ